MICVRACLCVRGCGCECVCVCVCVCSSSEAGGRNLARALCPGSLAEHYLATLILGASQRMLPGYAFVSLADSGTARPCRQQDCHLSTRDTLLVNDSFWTESDYTAIQLLAAGCDL